MKHSIYLGFEPRQPEAYAVARHTFSRSSGPIKVRGLNLVDVREAGLYRRETTIVDDRLYDVISEHPMATEHAISRFLTPILAKEGWALFSDCDVMKRAGPSLWDLMLLAERNHSDEAIVCVKHDYTPTTETKMDGQVQSLYGRKNWSSFMLFNCDHPANRALTVDLINSVPGRDLHRFCWLEDESLIGELEPSWNFLVGHTSPTVEAWVAHFTEGLPDVPGFEDCAYADEWRQAYREWVRG
jgi:hypothetical protein